MSETMVATDGILGGSTLPALRVRAVSAQMALLLAAAFVLPALAHAAGVPGRVWLPMHWPVIFAGLCYGWRSGALIGLAAPGVSFLLSGMPPAVVLPGMTAELAAYGMLVRRRRPARRQCRGLPRKPAQGRPVDRPHPAPMILQFCRICSCGSAGDGIR